jgi:hypothetical protein
MELRRGVSMLAIKTEEGTSEPAVALIPTLKRGKIKNNMTKITLRTLWEGKREL